jgi:hypothetical protein
MPANKQHNTCYNFRACIEKASLFGIVPNSKNCQNESQAWTAACIRRIGSSITVQNHQRIPRTNTPAAEKRHQQLLATTAQNTSEANQQNREESTKKQRILRLK